MPPKTILVPLTLADNSREILWLARDIAMKSEAKLILLHVVQLNIAGEEYGIPRTRLLNDLCQNAELHLQRLADCLGGNVVTEVLICEGRPGEAIVETATRLHTDMIVMRSHGRRGWQSWFRRNTARTVLRQAPCKVCLVLAENCDATVPLMIADHKGIKLFSERLPFREKRSRTQSLFRALFL
jgi:nucleotide-binding universal stress UspA family protein